MTEAGTTNKKRTTESINSKMDVKCVRNRLTNFDSNISAS
jgi:hypothetical protein